MKDVGEDVAISSLDLFQGDMDLPPLYFHASLEEQWDEEEEPEEIEAVLKVVPPAYHQCLDVFSKVKAQKLPPHHACDHQIELEGLLPPVGVIWSSSKNESEALWAYLSENLEKGFIRQSSFSTGAPVLFVKKKDWGLRLCVDYRTLNAVTRKNKYPVPPLNHLLTVFKSSTIFSKIDLCGDYNLLRIKEGDEHLTAFRTNYGSYEYFYIPFGSINAPASFQNLVNDLFAYFLATFVVVYLNDIMVFSSSEEEHVKHVASVLQRLMDNNLFAKASNCVFNASSVEYLGYVVSSEGLKMDSSKAQQILNWPQQKNIKALQSFLGFSNFYHCSLKVIRKRSLLLLPSFKKILLSSSMRKRLVSFKYSKTLSPLLLSYPISILLYKLLQTGHFTIFLSHQDSVYPERGVDFISKNHQNVYQVLKQNGIKESRLFSIKVEVFSDLVDQIRKAVWQDKDHKEILSKLARGESVSDYTLEAQAKLLLFKDRVVIPSNHELQLDILQKRHESHLAGHQGQEKNLKLIKRDFYWTGLNQIIKDYVSSCQQCSRNKNIHHKKF
ncbi:hypothetical protein O181_032008 [Austropuccinia psidii MF-1]|uniref:Reverse transcriptase domain-containing protein n=1 Tax=Austropuccinia psidii MF-1 TaxID=1389203 RepID=A0A9Q3H550_9BASI|nr:hypothetical protein [Austropuccinia psidii MF-1]